MGSYDPALQAAPRSGCGLTVAILTALVTILMVVAGLFLPPFSLYQRLFGTQYTALERMGDTAATLDGSFRVILPQDTASIGVSVDRTPLVSFAYSSTDDPAWITTARAALPSYLALLSDVYGVQTSSTRAVALTYSVDEPSAAQPNVLDMYGYTRVSNTWSFIPSRWNNRRIEATTDRRYDAVALFQAALLPPKLVVEYDVNQFLTADVAALADIVAPAGLQPTLTGALTGSLAPGFDLEARYQVMPVIRDYADPRALDTETVVAILANSDLRREHIRQLTALSGGFDGVWLDYRGVSADQRTNMSLFISDLGTALHQADMTLGVMVSAPVRTEAGWETGAYDWAWIGQHADYVQVPMPLDPMQYLEGREELVQAMLVWGVGEIDRTRLMMGLSARSVREIGSVHTLVGYDEALAGLGDVVVSTDTVTSNGIVAPGSVIRARLDGQPALAGVDTRINTPYVEYLNADGNAAARIWLTTSDALRWRLDAGEGLAMAGAVFDDLLTADLAEGVFRAISDYKLQIPAATAPTDLVLRWRVEGTNGLLQEIITPLGQSLETTMNAPDGNYAVNVVITGMGEDVEESARSGAVVAMFAATPTPTPLPTLTPTPLPTVTPTPAPIIATAVPVADAAPSGGGWAAVRPGAGSIRLGQFEYGGHVTSASSAATIGAMKRAGMTWMKVQMRYTPGANAAEAANYISVAQQNGFKVLIGTVGNPGDLANGGDGYISGYANWLAAIASMSPNAIEVWNEPNLDREWPNGQISGAAYASMLRIAYSAIKSTNSSVVVISAAPGPTGAEAAYPGAVMNDDRWLAEVVAAGGLGYADCVGIHYNEGIVPPSASSGDPRDGYYTRYFPLIVDTYWRITGGQKPLCITELGYLTPEGYGALDPYFAWASNVTVAQQAAWLAEAAALASQSGKVKLMIVWNVDFSYYGADPMAGFAIIRPDGSCPACDAMAAAR